MRRTHYCGAYWGYGFHEDGVVARAAGVRALRGGARVSASALYEGWVRHRRLEPVEHEFRYRHLHDLPRPRRAARACSTACRSGRRAAARLARGLPGRPRGRSASGTSTRRARRAAARGPSAAHQRAHLRPPVQPGQPLLLLRPRRRAGRGGGRRGHEHALGRAPRLRAATACDGDASTRRFHVSPFLGMDADYRLRADRARASGCAVHMESRRDGPRRTSTPRSRCERRELSAAGPLLRYPLHAAARAWPASTPGRAAQAEGRALPPAPGPMIARGARFSAAGPHARRAHRVVEEPDGRRDVRARPAPTLRGHHRGAHDPRFWRRCCAAASALGRARTSPASGTATTWSRWCASARARCRASTACGARSLPLRSALAARAAQHARGARAQHIAAHYDLGNDLFGLFLDETMTYSCAVFERARDDAAPRRRRRKLDRICRKLELGPDDHLLEIGTGWGSLALHAAARYGCRVTTTTISTEQHARGARAGARRRARRPRRGARRRTTATCAGATTSSSRSR